MKNRKIGFQILKDVKLFCFIENKNEKQKHVFKYLIKTFSKTKKDEKLFCFVANKK